MGWMSMWMVVVLIVFLAAVAGAAYIGVRLAQRGDDDITTDDRDKPPAG